MSVILSIDTSTKVGSIALHENGQLKIYHENFIEKSHSEYLAKTISEIFNEFGVSPNQLDAVAISRGPGSYTGLRIGVSIAKGICFAHDIKLIAVDTLKSMAFEVISFNTLSGFFCPMIDARRMEVYCQIFDENLNELNNLDAHIVQGDSFNEWVGEQKLYFFGNGSDKCRDIIRHENAVFVSDIYPKAKYIGALAYNKYKEKKFENLAYFEPYYLKEFMVKKPSRKNTV